MDDFQLFTEAEFAALPEDMKVEYLRLLEIDLKTWKYTPVQARAEERAQECKELLFGGSAGGGKSDWLLHHAHDLSTRIPGHRSLLLRRSFPELRRSLILRARMRIKQDEAVYKSAVNELHYKNGSMIEFGHLENEESTAIYLSAEYDFIGFDEAVQFTEDMVVMVGSRCRSTLEMRKRGCRPHVAYATNPGGISHGYFKDRFVERTNNGEFTYVDEHERRCGFVPAKVSDNPYMDPSYESWLMALPEVRRRQLLHGDWDVFAGQYFPEFDRRLHVCDPFDIPAHWQRVRGIDWGWAAPFACVWVAFNPDDGQAVVYRELGGSRPNQGPRPGVPGYGTRLTPQQQAAKIVAVSAGERYTATVADPSTFGRGNGIEKPIAVQWKEAGLPVARATNARIAGWTNIREYLKLEPEADGEDPTPGIRFFSTCPRTIKTMTELVHDTTHPEDVDTDGDDHLADSVRYALAVRPRRHKAKPPPGQGGLEARVAKWRESRRRSGRRVSSAGVA